MSRKALKEKMLTVPEVKQLLESIGEENLDQFQRRAFDYTAKFAKVEAKPAKELVKGLVKKFELEEEEAVQVVNCMPESIEEIRVFLAGGRKIVETQKLEDILTFLNQHRKKE
ncbi:MAG: RNA polymerase Rpb4 [Candidatus Bathyarchaeota archaeon]|nr:RNA polymerase Rpb4 [Candidatus Bathyarchaeota archaeon]MDH5494225.1 RNA polymerase Rpb4 [Candidatus Bathyarchaeota archaeon]